MGLSLFNRRICNTYPGVIKTCDNAALTVTPKPMTDGVGNDVPINIGTSTICYGGTQDFTGATVIGISGATAGLVSGVGTNSMVSSGSLAVLSTADGSCSISIGNGAYNDQERSISIGQGATGLCVCSITVGFAANGNGNNVIALGNNTSSVANCAISIGEAAQGGGSNSIGIGTSSNARCANSIAIGNVSDVLSSNTTAVGTSTCIGPSSNSSTVIGQNATSLSASSLAAGLATCVGTGATNSIAIGCGAFIESYIGTSPSAHNDSIAIGSQAKVCNTTSLSASTTTRSIAIGPNATVCSYDAISIGSGAIVEGCGDYGISIGYESVVYNMMGISIGCWAFTGCATRETQCSAIAIGHQVSTRCGGIVIGGSGSGNTEAHAINIGKQTNSGGSCDVGIGFCSTGAGNGFSKTSIGTFSYAANNASISIGWETCARNNYSSVLGARSCTNADCAVALGYNVTANRTDVVTACEYESCVAGCGLIVKTPDGLNSYRISVDNSGNLTTALA